MSENGDDREITLTWGEIKDTDNRLKRIENNIDYARFDVQEQRIEALEKKTQAIKMTIREILNKLTRKEIIDMDEANHLREKLDKASGGEKEKGISIVADEDSPKIIPKESDQLNSKLPELPSSIEYRRKLDEIRNPKAEPENLKTFMEAYSDGYNAATKELIEEFIEDLNIIDKMGITIAEFDDIYQKWKGWTR